MRRPVYPITGEKEATLLIGHDGFARGSVVLHRVVFFRKSTSILRGQNRINQQSQGLLYIGGELPRLMRSAPRRVTASPVTPASCCAIHPPLAYRERGSHIGAN